MKNIQIYKETLQFIKDNPDQWDQSWIKEERRTSFCFLSWILTKANLWRDEMYRTELTERIVYLLGISSEEASYLWDGTRTIADFEEFLSQHEDRKSYTVEDIRKAYLAGNKASEFKYICVETLLDHYIKSI